MRRVRDALGWEPVCEKHEDALPKERGGECSPERDNQRVTAQLIGHCPISSAAYALDSQVEGTGIESHLRRPTTHGLKFSVSRTDFSLVIS